VKPYLALLFVEPPEVTCGETSAAVGRGGSGVWLRTAHGAELRVDQLTALMGGITSLARARVGACAVRLPPPQQLLSLYAGGALSDASALVELAIASLDCSMLPFVCVMDEQRARELRHRFARRGDARDAGAADAGGASPSEDDEAGEPPSPTDDDEGAHSLLADAALAISKMLSSTPRSTDCDDSAAAARADADAAAAEPVRADTDAAAAAPAAAAGGGGGGAYGWKAMLVDSARLTLGRVRVRHHAPTQAELARRRGDSVAGAATAAAAGDGGDDDDARARERARLTSLYDEIARESQRGFTTGDNADAVADTDGGAADAADAADGSRRLGAEHTVLELRDVVVANSASSTAAAPIERSADGARVVVRKRVTISRVEKYRVDARGARVPTLMPLDGVALDVTLTRRARDGAVVDVDVDVAVPVRAAALLNPDTPTPTRVRVRLADAPVTTPAHDAVHSGAAAAAAALARGGRRGSGAFSRVGTLRRVLSPQRLLFGSGERELEFAKAEDIAEARRGLGGQEEWFKAVECGDAGTSRRLYAPSSSGRSMAIGQTGR